MEWPLLSDALSLLPRHVIALSAAQAPDPPWKTARPAQAILAGSLIRYNAELLDQLPNLRIIVRVGIGIDNVDAQACTERGIAFCNTPDGPTESTAEHTVAMIMAVAKRLKPGDASIAAGGFGPRSALVGNEVAGKTLGLVGFGRIGRRVAEICRLGLGMKVVATDPFVSPEEAEAHQITLADLDTVLASADFLSLHAPAIPETYKLMNRERIAKMKDGAYLFNLARGPLVDEEALLEAVNSGKLAGAGLDVFDPEPPAPDSPIRNHPNIIVTPHSASVTVEGRSRMEHMAVQRVIDLFQGEIPADLINPEVLQGR
jgi:D-3-phosphoglycerate dehydrogenase